MDGGELAAAFDRLVEVRGIDHRGHELVDGDRHVVLEDDAVALADVVDLEDPVHRVDKGGAARRQLGGRGGGCFVGAGEEQERGEQEQGGGSLHAASLSPRDRCP